MANLATSGIDELGSRSESEYLTFLCDGDAYAVSLAAVQEIVVPPPLTPVPRSRPAILGVASVRGQLVTVVDFRIVMGLAPDLGQRRGRLLLGRGPDQELMALKVTEVHQVLRLTPQQLETTGASSSGDFSEIVRGMGRPERGKVVALLDIYALFAKGTR